jgi:hypothetical protein
MRGLTKQTPSDYAPIRRCFWPVCSPDSVFTKARGIAGNFLILYDACVMPMLFFHDVVPVWASAMDWVSRAWWTADILVCTQTAYTLADTNLETNRWRILKHYLRHGFPQDFLATGADWLGFTLSLILSAQKSDRNFGRALRASRVLKVMRFVRIMKVIQSIKWLKYQITSEYFVFYFEVCQLVLCLLLINHMSSGIFYMISYQMKALGYAAWIDEFDETLDATLAVRYSTSLYWSIGQFTGIDAGIIPRNTMERLFGAVLTFFALFATATCVSKISALMIASAQHEGNNDFHLSILRKYLAEKQISHDLMYHVMRNVEIAVLERSKHIVEEDVQFMSLISGSLSREIHFETRSPTLFHHLLFSEIGKMDLPLLKKVCEVCVKETEIVLEERIFRARTQPVHAMFFLHSGYIHYRVENGVKVESCVAGSWFCEAALWTAWRPVGTAAVIKRDARVFEVNAVAFQGMATEFHESRLCDLSSYARRFVEYLNDRCNSTSAVTDRSSIAAEDGIFPRITRRGVSRLTRISSRVSQTSVRFVSFRIGASSHSSAPQGM